jgi:von Willebrand factor type A domain
MEGSRIIKAKDALKFFLSSLPDDSYFNIIFFSFSPERAFPESSVKYTQQNLIKAFEIIDKRVAQGGTELYGAMEDAFKLQSIEGYTKNFFVLTDGDIGNTLQVVELIKKNCGLGRGFVYSIGIGSGASEFLVEEISKAGKGQFVMISDEEDPKDKLGSLLSDSLSPRLTDFVVTFDKEYIKGLTPILNKDSSVSIN